MTSRVEQLRSEMAAALAEAEAQEMYEGAHELHLADLDDPAAKENRRAAAEDLRAVRERLRNTRPGPVDGAITPAPITASAKVKEIN
jgi:hypothetical protein